MDAEVKAFIDKRAEKLAAKEKAIIALGNANAYEAQGKTAEAAAAFETVAEQGRATGIEGKCDADMQKMADAYVMAHPELFTHLQPYILPDGTAKEQEQAQDTVVALAAMFHKAGDYESEARVMMWELAYFPRKSIGSAMKVVYRVPSLGGKK
jgi:hypothetical protein